MVWLSILGLVAAVRFERNQMELTDEHEVDCSDRKPPPLSLTADLKGMRSSDGVFTWFFEVNIEKELCGEYFLWFHKAGRFVRPFIYGRLYERSEKLMSLEHCVAWICWRCFLSMFDLPIKKLVNLLRGLCKIC